MTGINHLVSAYMSRLPLSIVRERTFDEVIRALRKKIDIKEIILEELYSHQIKMAKKNAFNSINNLSSMLTMDELELIAFKLSNNSKSVIYYEQNDDIQTEIYAIIERHTNYVFSNNNILQLEIMLLCGINKSHYETESMVLLGYLHYIDQYENVYNCDYDTLIKLLDD